MFDLSEWLTGGLIALALGLSGYVYILKADNKVTTAEKEQAIHGQELVSAMLEANRVEYEANRATAKEEVMRLQKEHTVKIKIIENKWRDKNATCTDAMHWLNNYNF